MFYLHAPSIRAEDQVFAKYSLFFNGTNLVHKGTLLAHKRTLKETAMTGQIQNKGKLTIYKLCDPLTVSNVKPFLIEMHSLIAEGKTHIILDLSDVKIICLMAMVGISNLFNECRLKGGALKVACLSPQVRRAFSQTNLINTVEIFEEASEAAKSFESKNLLKSQTLSGSYFMEDSESFVVWDRIPQTAYFN
jgi:anti-sigma B factor antagonist